MAAYSKTQAPHITSSETVLKVYVSLSLALLPIYIVSFLFFGAVSLQLLVSSLLGGALAEFLGWFAFKRPYLLRDGSALWISMLFALMLPANTPPWLAFGGLFLGLFFGRECFGGLGSYYLNPALLGRLLIFLLWPTSLDVQRNAEHILLDSLPATLNSFLIRPGFALAEVSPVIIVLGGLLLIFKNRIRWEVPVLFLVSNYVLIYFFGYPPALRSSFSGISGLWFCAFFLMADPTATPISKMGMRIYAVVASLGLYAFSFQRQFFDGACLWLLITNVVTPWLDKWCQPRRSKGAPCS